MFARGGTLSNEVMEIHSMLVKPHSKLNWTELKINSEKEILKVNLKNISNEFSLLYFQNLSNDFKI